VNIVEKLELHELYVALVPWSNWLVMTNASINICIYCMFSDKYRRLMMHYLRCCRRLRKGGADGAHNHFHSTNLSSL